MTWGVLYGAGVGAWKGNTIKLLAIALVRTESTDLPRGRGSYTPPPFFNSFNDREVSKGKPRTFWSQRIEGHKLIADGNPWD